MPTESYRAVFGCLPPLPHPMNLCIWVPRIRPDGGAA